MALIIKGKMPDTCLSEISSELHCPIIDGCLAFHNAYHHRFEPIENAHKCRLEDCPIIGEIPDEHGRIVDISRVEDFLTKWENGELDYEPYLDEVLSMIRYSIKTILEATE